MSNSQDEKRIAMFSIHSDPLASLGSQESGGQNIYVRHLGEELQKFGWKTDVFTRWDSYHKKEVVNVNKNFRVIRLKGGPINFVPKIDLFSLLPEIFNNFVSFIKQENPYKIFHGHYWDGGWMALSAAEKFGKPLVQNFHSLGIVRMETKKKYLKNTNEDEYFINRLNTENEIIKKSKIIISLSQTEKEELNRLYGCPLEKIKVIPGGINLKHWPLIDKQKAREYLNLKREDFIILFVGRLEWRKGVGTLISAGRLIKECIPNIKIIIVGGKIYGRNKNKADVKEYKRLIEKAKEEKIEDLIFFTGNIEHGQLSNYYRAADIFVVPSYYEPFGLVTLEGMANKVPVIASNTGGLSTIIKNGKNGLLFEPRNAKDLKEKILLLYQSKDLINTLTENAYRDIKENYSWHQIVKNINDIYNEIIKNENSSNSAI